MERCIRSMGRSCLLPVASWLTLFLATATKLFLLTIWRSVTGKRFDISGVVLYHPRTMKPQPKTVPVRDPHYLAWIRTLPCIRCDRPSGFPTEAHHQPAVGHSSVGSKCDDTRAIPLCTVHHAQLHRIGRRSFWGDFDVELCISKLNVEFFLRSL